MGIAMIVPDLDHIIHRWVEQARTENAGTTSSRGLREGVIKALVMECYRLLASLEDEQLKKGKGKVNGMGKDSAAKGLRLGSRWGKEEIELGLGAVGMRGSGWDWVRAVAGSDSVGTA